MIHIHATKKLYAKLPVNAEGLVAHKLAPESSPAVVSDNPLSGWHANLITLQRRNCVLLVHDATRFPLFIKSLVKADFADFNWHFDDVLMNTLLKIGANQQQLDRAISLLASCQFDTVCNRSVQGTMNQMTSDLKYSLYVDGANLEDVSNYRTGVWLADRPCTIKGEKECIWPQKAMIELLSKPTVACELAVTNDNIVQLVDYRQRHKK